MTPEQMNAAAMVTLKEYVDSRLMSVNERCANCAEHIEKSARIAADALIRDQSREQAATFATRAEVAGLREWRSAIDAKASQNAVNVSLGIAIIGLIVASVSLAIQLLG